jgi:TAG lipase/lysophosphatidylethanolamine acyltransferase
MISKILSMFLAAWELVYDVTTFWCWVRLISRVTSFAEYGVSVTNSRIIRQTLWGRWNQKSPLDQLLERQNAAQTFEEWEDIAYRVDGLLGNDLWRQNPTSRDYDYRLIYERLQAIISSREEGDLAGMINLLRSGLVRNLGNINSLKLFSRAYAGTKLLIEDYITSVALAIQAVTYVPATDDLDGVFTQQAKVDLLHDTRQAFGRSTLVLQGGAVFGLCHLGVVKALHLRGLLPRIITGTATGALIAALVCIHTEEELLELLTGEAIDLSAFDFSSRSRGKKGQPAEEQNWLTTLLRRTRRYLREGYFLDAKVLEECVRANVGNLTFEEAYERSKRVLNITVAVSGREGMPNLLNYITAPNVLIWSAAVASNTSKSALYSANTIYCKDQKGDIVEWAIGEAPSLRSWISPSTAERESPLLRIAELFNVNHFIVSQARPYLIPFLRSDLYRMNPRQSSGRAWSVRTPIFRMVGMEIRHRLHQLNTLGLLPVAIRRFLVDESIPGASIVLVPDISPADFFSNVVLENPSKRKLEHWVLRGEKAVWPAVSALKVRCALEVELDRAYQLVRRRRVGAFGAVEQR